MTILIANIGTSDLSIQLNIDGQKYYLPIEFLLFEPNLKQQVASLPPNLQFGSNKPSIFKMNYTQNYTQN